MYLFIFQFGTEWDQTSMQNFNWTSYLLKLQVFQKEFGELIATNVSLTEFFLYKGSLDQWLQTLTNVGYQDELTMEEILKMYVFYIVKEVELFMSTILMASLFVKTAT